jgi:hypothetical protein
MKQLLAGITICTSILWIACKNPNTPENTAIKFLNSLYNYDFEMAKSMSTRNTWGMLNIMNAKTKDVSDEKKQENIGKLRVTITDTQKETDSTVIVYFSTEPSFQIFKGIRILEEEEDGRPRYKVDMSSLDSLSGFDDIIIEEETLPIKEDTVIVE